VTSGTGFRVFASTQPISVDVLKRFLELDLVNVSDAMYGMSSVDDALRPLWGPVPRVSGAAVTVSVTPGNGQMIRRAILLCRPGDVIVVNAFGTEERAVLGGSIVADMRANGVAAVIVDGAVRDRSEISAQRFPVFARAVTTRGGTDTNGRGEVNAPVACGGVVVCGGDLVLADDEGIVVVPRRDLEHVYERASGVQARMGNVRELGTRVEEARHGRVRGYEKVADALRSGGCVELEQTWDGQGNSA
jgi:4-hydroxy-4-methyl-2-oxoglutarate aldolase